MNEYISIRSVLNRIPTSVREEISEGWLLSRILDAYRDLDIAGRLVDDVKIVTISNHLAQIPKEVKKLNLVTYSCEEPDDCELNELLCQSGEEDKCGECTPVPADYLTRTNNVCDIPITYQLFFDSQFYNRAFIPLKFVGETKGNLCTNCINRMLHDCRETFSITPERNILSTVKDGYLCLDFKTEPKDEEGNFLIIDDPRLIQGLSLYAEAQAWRNRRGLKEQSANVYYNESLQQAEILLKSFKGRSRLRSIDAQGIIETTFTQTPNQKIMRLPGNYLNNNN